MNVQNNIMEKPCQAWLTERRAIPVVRNQNRSDDRAWQDEPAGRAPKKANIMNKECESIRPGCLAFPESGSSKSIDQ
jgi:hypothetical protein